MSHQQEIDSCFAAGGIPRTAYDALLARTVAGLDQLRKGGLQRLVERHDDLDAAQPLLDHLLNNTSDLVVLGGGPAAQAIAQMADRADALAKPEEGRPRLHFLDNLDPHNVDRALDTLDLRTTRFLVISRSGAEAEALAPMFAAMGRIQGAGGGKYMRFHFGAIAVPGDNPLRAIAAEQNFPVADYDSDAVCGFAALSNAALVPALAMGLDAAAIRAGAAKVLAPVLAGVAPEEVAAARGAALAVAAAGQGLDLHVMLADADRLAGFGEWWRKLWAEGLGMRSVPIFARDATGGMQLWREYPRNALFTVLAPQVAGTGATVPAELATAPALSHLAGRTIGDLAYGGRRATVAALTAAGRPVRTVALPSLDLEALGGLFMHFTLETLLAADLMGVEGP
jgi:glucose-6-phosphate isomerase